MSKHQEIHVMPLFEGTPTALEAVCAYSEYASHSGNGRINKEARAL